MVQKTTIMHSANDTYIDFEKKFDDYINEETTMIKSFLSFVSSNQQLYDSFITKNKEKLFDQAQTIYTTLYQNNDITHFYFIEPNGKVLLRVHDYQRDGDIIGRYTYKQAKKTQKIASGLEFGLKKNYTLRVVIPWIVNNKLVGYIEIGKEIDKIILSLSEQLNIQIYFAVNKNEYKNAPPFIKKDLQYLKQTNDHYLVYNTAPIHSSILTFLNNKQNNEWIEIGDNHFVGFTHALKDVSEKNLGEVLHLVDISKQYNDLHNLFIYYIMVIMAVTLAIIIFAYFFYMKKQKELDELLQKVQKEKEKTEAAYYEKKNLLQLFDKGDSVLFRWNNDKHWSIDYVSVNVANLLGYTQEEFLASKIAYANCIHKDDLPHVLQEVEKGSLSSNDFFKHQPYRIITKDGTIKWVLDYTVLSKDPDGNIKFYLGYIIDITERKLANDKLVEQKQEFETIFNYVKDGIAITDLEGNFLNCNQDFIRMTGFTKEEILKENCSHLTAQEYREKNQQALNNAIHNGSIENIEKECVLKNGKRVFVNMSISLLPDKKRLLLLIHDNTTLKAMQEQTKLASLGEMIGNIAHQWRQPLNVISTSASGVSLRTDFGNIDDKTIKESMTVIVQQSQYLSKTIDDFRNFISDNKRVDEKVSIKALIEDVIDLTSASLNDNFINLVLDLQADIQIIGNKNELEQAFINIINNAKDSLKENVMNEDDRYIIIATKSLDPKTLQMKINDSGGGIPLNIIDKIFEPYFTTKHQSIGTGLGLSMVNKIIRERHGFELKTYNEDISFGSENHHGACFEIIFKKASN